MADADHNLGTKLFNQNVTLNYLEKEVEELKQDRAMLIAALDEAISFVGTSYDPDTFNEFLHRTTILIGERG